MFPSLVAGHSVGGSFAGERGFTGASPSQRSIFFTERFSAARGVKETSSPDAEGGWHGSDGWGGKAVVRESSSRGETEEEGARPLSGKYRCSWRQVKAICFSCRGLSVKQRLLAEREQNT
ncbi:hypothetical protein [Bacteroides pyogenes]|uniref:hypothetical protein n=1 Tax=Bacteroides pyogenes TaxID=310300 RepID=UPI0003DD3287|nr:hypothetical protein [Bacteroides pyogenes]MBB3895732.1 hypothetical protein [Bacteroides pyogenes]GAE22786.1 hypothetical protein JCM10003_2440 [Bacteroides pyogenes JCM 10003]